MLINYEGCILVETTIKCCFETQTFISNIIQILLPKMTRHLPAQS